MHSCATQKSFLPARASAQEQRPVGQQFEHIAKFDAHHLRRDRNRIAEQCRQVTSFERLLAELRHGLLLPAAALQRDKARRTRSGYQPECPSANC